MKKIVLLLLFFATGCTSYSTERWVEYRENVAKNKGFYQCSSFQTNTLTGKTIGSKIDSVQNLGDHFVAEYSGKIFRSPKLIRQEKIQRSEQDNIIYVLGDDGSFAVNILSENIMYSWVECVPLKEIEQLVELANKYNLVCDSYKDSRGLNKSELILGNNKFKKPFPIIKTSQTSCIAETQLGKPTLIQSESGLLDNVSYSFDYNGSASIGDMFDGGWSIHCKKDPINDRKQCSLDAPLAAFSILKYQNRYTVLVGKNHFPGSKIYLRINNGKVYSSDNEVFSFAVSEDIIKNIKNGSMLSIRYTEWPYNHYVDKQIEIKGFEQAKKLIDMLYENLK